MGYYCIRNQLAVEPEVPRGSDVTRRNDSFIGKLPPITSTDVGLNSTNMAKARFGCENIHFSYDYLAELHPAVSFLK